MKIKSMNKFGGKFAGVIRAPMASKGVILRDILEIQGYDPGPLKSIDLAFKWICKAQDSSLSQDGGVASYYHLLRGWSPSYPETTGYIIPTIISYSKKHNDPNLMERAERMLNWLVSIQLPEGSFQAGLIDNKPITPCTFNTGQILIGLSEGVRTFGNQYKTSMRKAADWLVKTQDDDGCWRKFPTHLAEPGEKTYETHVAWGLFEAADVDENEEYFKCALKNIHWALKHQNENGWFAKCCLKDSRKPLTHTLGYAFRGILEAYRYSKEDKILSACRKLADGLIIPLQENGFLPGRLKSDWSGAASWACLTGNVQIGYCWWCLFEMTGKKDYLNAASLANKYVRKTQLTRGPEEIRGGIKGSFPIYGDYHKYQFINWAAKFLIDSNQKEIEITSKLRSMHNEPN